MSKQHYLPATYLAYFSKDKNPVRRKRKIWVGFKSDGKIINFPAEYICKIKNLYNSSLNGFNWSVDENWSNIEPHLAQAIEDLANRELTGLTWAWTLVPFVTSLLIRGPDFGNRMINRFPEFANRIDINVARSMEFQRLLPVIAVAKWSVFRVENKSSLITNELGYVISETGFNKEKGISIPIADKKIILTIVPRERRSIIKSINNKFIPIIEYPNDFGKPINPKQFNAIVNNYAQYFVIGEKKSLVEDYLTIKNHENLPLEPFQIGFPVQFGRFHEMSWAKLIHLLLNESPRKLMYMEINLHEKPEGNSVIFNPIITKEPFSIFKD